MLNHPLVSIYIPTKNRASSLCLAIQSVLAQDYRNIEVIVVDDGSNDTTSTLLANLIQEDSRLICFRLNESMGACYARNFALMNASGYFATGLDDDDEFLENHISSLVDAWGSHTSNGCEPSFLYFDQILRNGNSSEIWKKEMSIDEALIFKGNCFGNQIFARLSTYKDCGLFDEEMPAWQDFEFFYRVFKEKGPPSHVNRPTYIFDISPREDRISSSQRAKIFAAYNLMCQKHTNGNGRLMQELMLYQFFGEHYGFRVTFKDIVAFAQHGVWIKGYLKLMKLYLYRR